MKKADSFTNVIKILLVALPCAIYFSYSPRIYLGANEFMQFELSLPLILLVVFDIVSAIYILKNRKKMAEKIKKFFGYKLLIFSSLPIYATLSIIWSENKIHGILASGILWLIFFAVVFIAYFFKDFFKEKKFRHRFLKTFMIFSAVICLACWIQSILDNIGVSRDITMMCIGCTARNFGFPHPNGFMAEPQYLGGVLLAPALLSLYFFFKKTTWKNGLLAAFFLSTIFLSFSRGAIYSLIIAFVFISLIQIYKTKKFKQVLASIAIFIGSFCFTLNMQGIFAATSYTNDTYFSGISKVINQLSLGIIELPEKETEDEPKEEPADVEESASIHTGYVPQSTDARTALTKASIALWRSSPRYSIFGAGIGSAGVSIYRNFVDPGTANDDVTKEIIISNNVDDPSLNVQNEYMEILAEFGIIGVILVILIAIEAYKQIRNHASKDVLLAIGVAFLVASIFCSGLTNSLYIYLMIPILGSVLFYGEKSETI